MTPRGLDSSHFACRRRCPYLGGPDSEPALSGARPPAESSAAEASCPPWQQQHPGLPALAQPFHRPAAPGRPLPSSCAGHSGQCHSSARTGDWLTNVVSGSTLSRCMHVGDTGQPAAVPPPTGCQCSRAYQWPTAEPLSMPTTAGHPWRGDSQKQPSLIHGQAAGATTQHVSAGEPACTTCRCAASQWLP